MTTFDYKRGYSNIALLISKVKISLENNNKKKGEFYNAVKTGCIYTCIF
jgi:hypothetical protein